MNKNFELAKLMAFMSLVLALISSSLYLGFVITNTSAYQFLDGREQLAESIFNQNISGLKSSYTLFAITLVLIAAALYFAYKGYKDTKLK